MRPHHLRRDRRQRRAADRRPPRLAGDAGAAAVRALLRRQLRSQPGLRRHRPAALDRHRPRSRQPRADAVGRRRLPALAEPGERHPLRLRALAHPPHPGRRAAQLHRPRLERLVGGDRAGAELLQPGVDQRLPDGGVPGPVRVDDLPALAGLRLDQGRAPVVVRRQLDPPGTRRHRAVPGQRHLHLQRHPRRRRPPRPRRPHARPAEPVPPGRQPDRQPVTRLLRCLRAGRVAGQRPVHAERRAALGAVPLGHRPQRLLQPLRHGRVHRRAAQHHLPERAGRADVRGRRGLPRIRPTPSTTSTSSHRASAWPGIPPATTSRRFAPPRASTTIRPSCGSTAVIR